MHLLIPEMIKARRDDLLQEAERSFLARVLAGIGGFLIAAGQKLQAPYISAMSCRPQAYQPRC